MTLIFKKTVKRLRPTKSVGLDDIPGFIIKECLTKLMPVLKYIFNPGVSQMHFLTEWKQSVIVPVHRKAIMPVLRTIDLYLFLIIFLKFLNLSHMTICFIILKTNFILLSMVSLNPNLLLPTWYHT